ncbi:nucleoside hydrolase [Kiritimatiellota bacterium B12222]|nr:nucleoside hydrolase [Kiritimatiellota bacterium B12222]
MKKRIPVILDTDIGGDVDDTWALIMLLRCPELDVKLVTTCSDYPIHRARHAAKVLHCAGRTDIPIGIGVPVPGEEPKEDATHIYPWIRDYPLENYPGTVLEDGAQAVIDTIHAASGPVTVIAIGPLNTLAEALRRDPEIIHHSRFVGMHGSVYVGYDGVSAPSSEANVRTFCSCCREVFQSGWDMTITPVDTCGRVKLTGEDYQRIRRSTDPLIQELMKANDIFFDSVTWMNYPSSTASSILFDTVAVYLAYSEEWVEIETLPIRIEDGGFTRIDQQEGSPVRCAVRWKDLDGFKQHLISRLLDEGDTSL